MIYHALQKFGIGRFWYSMYIDAFENKKQAPDLKNRQRIQEGRHCLSEGNPYPQICHPIKVQLRKWKKGYAG